MLLMSMSADKVNAAQTFYRMVEPHQNIQAKTIDEFTVLSIEECALR